MSNEEKKARMARNYAINSKKTPRTRRMAFTGISDMREIVRNITKFNTDYLAIPIIRVNTHTHTHTHTVIPY